MEGPGGPSGRATEPSSVALTLGGVEVEAGQHVHMACVISLLPHELLRPKQPVLAVPELVGRSFAAVSHLHCSAYRV